MAEAMREANCNEIFANRIVAWPTNKWLLAETLIAFLSSGNRKAGGAVLNVMMMMTRLS